MNDYVQQRMVDDRESHLNQRLAARKPIFKNFVDNNANILRREIQIKKMIDFKQKEKREQEIQYNLKNQSAEGFIHMNYDPESAAKVRPLRSIQRLQKNYENPNSKSSRQGSIIGGVPESPFASSQRTGGIVDPKTLFKAKDEMSF